jgi:hypothetical protein
MTATRLKWSILKPRLLSALSPGDWVTGDDLILSVYLDHDTEEPEYAKSMIWKLVQALRIDGFAIEAEIGRKSRGYRLVKQGDSA